MRKLVCPGGSSHREHSAFLPSPSLANLNWAQSPTKQFPQHFCPALSPEVSDLPAEGLHRKPLDFMTMPWTRVKTLRFKRQQQKYPPNHQFRWHIPQQHNAWRYFGKFILDLTTILQGLFFILLTGSSLIRDKHPTCPRHLRAFYLSIGRITSQEVQGPSIYQALRHSFVCPGRQSFGKGIPPPSSSCTSLGWKQS